MTHHVCISVSSSSRSLGVIRTRRRTAHQRRRQRINRVAATRAVATTTLSKLMEAVYIKTDGEFAIAASRRDDMTGDTKAA